MNIKRIAVSTLGLVAVAGLVAGCGGTTTKTVTVRVPVPGPVTTVTVTKDVPGPTVYQTSNACITDIVAYETAQGVYFKAVGILTSDEIAGGDTAVWNVNMAAVNAAVDAVNAAGTTEADVCISGLPA